MNVIHYKGSFFFFFFLAFYSTITRKYNIPFAFDRTRDKTIIYFNKLHCERRSAREQCLCKKRNEQCNSMKEKREEKEKKKRREIRTI